MIFTRLTIANFGVYGGRHELDLRPPGGDDARPIVLFGGKNGAGKTTILDAIRLCLYGRSAIGGRIRRADYETALRQRLHRGAAGMATSASIGLEIEHTHAGVRSTYDAVRSWRVDGQTIREDVSIYQDGAPLRSIAPEHWNDFLRDLIPPGVADLFFFDGEQMQALADDDRAPDALAAAIRGLLNLDLVDRLRADLNLYLRQQTQHDRPRLRAALDDAVAAHEAHETRLIERRQDKAQLVAQRDQVLAQLERSRQALLREGAGFVHGRAAIEARQAEVTREIEYVRNAIREFAAGLLPFAVAPAWLARLADRLRHESEAQRAEVAHEAQQEQATAIALRLLDRDFQQQAAPGVQPQDWARIASALQALLQPAAPPDITIRHPLATIERERLLGWIEQATQQLPAQLHTLTQQLETLEAERGALEQARSQIPQDAVAHPLLQQFHELAERKGRLDAQIDALDEELQQLRRVVDDHERERLRAYAQLAASGDADERTQRAAKVQLVLDRYLHEMTAIKVGQVEQAVAQYFNLLCRKSLLVQEVRIDPRGFQVTLYGPNRSELPKSDLSAGEKQLYALALLWALRSVSGRALPIIIDSPLGRLDTEHRRALLRHFFPHAAHQVVLLSTDTEIDSVAFDHLQPAVARSYRLHWDGERGATEVRVGYFGEGRTENTEQRTEEQESEGAREQEDWELAN